MAKFRYGAFAPGTENDALHSNAANIGERKTWTQSEFCTWQNSVRWQEPPKMYIYSVPAQAKHRAKFG